MMPSLSQYLPDSLQRPADSTAYRFTSQSEATFPSLRTKVRKPQKVERLRFALPSLLPVHFREPSEFHDSGFLRVQCQTKLRQPLPNILQVLLRVPLILKSDHHIVRIADNQGLALGNLRTPFLVKPEIKHIMQKYVSQRR